MAKCMNCGADIDLKEGDEKCPSCGEDPYFCNKCGNRISNKEKRCSVCRWMICDNCGGCDPDCMKNFQLESIKNLVTDREKLEKIYNNMQNPPQKVCPERNVPISHAKGALAIMARKLLMSEYKKNEKDKAWLDRFDNIQEYPIGKTWTVKQVVEDGYYGKEHREISNLAVCLGFAKIIKTKSKDENKKNIVITFYERINGKMCPDSNFDKLLVKYCSKCKKQFDGLEAEYCDVCPLFKQGKKKGQQRELKLRKSGKHFCQRDRHLFLEKKKVHEEINCSNQINVVAPVDDETYNKTKYRDFNSYVKQNKVMIEETEKHMNDDFDFEEVRARKEKMYEEGY